MRVHIGGDHAAYDLLGELVAHLEAAGHEVVNHGPFAYDAEDDYPVYVLRAAQAVAAETGTLGVVLGGSGNGARQHNNAQVISIGARMNTVEQAKSMVDTFVATPFSDEERHSRRIAMLSAFESDGTLPDLPAAPA